MLGANFKKLLNLARPQKFLKSGQCLRVHEMPLGVILLIEKQQMRLV